MMSVLTCCDIVCNSAAKQSDVMGLVFVFPVSIMTMMARRPVCPVCGCWDKGEG